MAGKQPPKCEYDPKLKTVIHKFTIGAAVCCCGSMSIAEKPKFHGGWRKLHDKEQER